MAVSGSSHNHGWKSVATGKLLDGFSFHPKLAEWLSTYTSIPKDADLEILEVSCGEVSCPTEETLIVWKEQRETLSSPELHPETKTVGTSAHTGSISLYRNHEFRISRKKENISKMDVDLSWKRFQAKS
ncbi:hypothetical protein [Leptospira bouyouniensis]|uniref:Uncharacterized protein n=1 Tax=Leptospira bouyouniensis TaxID=2484911 RepID=A0A7I0HX55_9LEPT|nr:hypothetical protein [Leptospira bouyouniensis]TGK49778.1 hypothetical protein EHQ10_07975 [Leptospira bouyouniensis]TGL09471.1 hypothetical protein EHQ43_00930 [Leptospira bouyouniensis]TGM77963.1 hypothetical protein EHQ99_16645 [Leptospira bouyouniensis]